MSDNVALDQLMVVRTNLEKELDSLLTEVAGKKNILQSLNTSIDLMRGWKPQDVVRAPYNKKLNNDTIRDGILDFFTSHEGDYSVPELAEHLNEQGIVPTYTPALRGRLYRILTEIPEVTIMGKGRHATYKLVQTQGA